MKSLLLIAAFSIFSPDVQSNELQKMKTKLILKIEKKAKQYEVFKVLHKATNIHTDYGSLRIRPGDIRFDKKFNGKHLRIETNGKDNVKANFSFSF